MSEASELRQRGSKSSANAKEAPARSPAAIAKAEDKGSNVFLEAARTLLLLFVMSSALSYFVTREDIFWGMKRPAWTRPDVVKTWFVSSLHPHLPNIMLMLFCDRMDLRSLRMRI